MLFINFGPSFSITTKCNPFERSETSNSDCLLNTFSRVPRIEYTLISPLYWNLNSSRVYTILLNPH